MAQRAPLYKFFNVSFGGRQTAIKHALCGDHSAGVCCFRVNTLCLVPARLHPLGLGSLRQGTVGPPGPAAGRSRQGLQHHLSGRASCSFIPQSKEWNLPIICHLSTYLSPLSSIYCVIYHQPVLSVIRLFCLPILSSVYSIICLLIYHTPSLSIISLFSYGLLVFIKYNSWVVFPMLDNFRQTTTSLFPLKCFTCFQKNSDSMQLIFFFFEKEVNFYFIRTNFLVSRNGIFKPL